MYYYDNEIYSTGTFAFPSGSTVILRTGGYDKPIDIVKEIPDFVCCDYCRTKYSKKQIMNEKIYNCVNCGAVLP